MIRLASSPAPNIKLLARSALTMLSSPVLMQESNARPPDKGAAALEVLRDWAKGDGPESHFVPQPEMQVQAPDRPLEIAPEDWDVLFRAIEARLSSIVVEHVPAPTGSHAHDASALVRSTVLECVAALRQLHMALAMERGRNDSIYATVGEAPAGQASAMG